MAHMLLVETAAPALHRCCELHGNTPRRCACWAYISRRQPSVNGPIVAAIVIVTVLLIVIEVLTLQDAWLHCFIAFGSTVQIRVACNDTSVGSVQRAILKSARTPH